MILGKPIGVPMGKTTGAGKSSPMSMKEENKSCESVAKFIPEMVEINKAVKALNFMDAYKIIDQLIERTKRRGYTVEDRKYVHAKLIEVLVKEYGSDILRIYDTIIDQYRKLSIDEINYQRIIDGYPRQTGQSDKEYNEAYFRKKAREEINAQVGKYRYGGHMHYVVDKVLNPEKYCKEDSKDNNGSTNLPTGKKKIVVSPLPSIPGVNDDRDDR